MFYLFIQSVGLLCEIEGEAIAIAVQNNDAMQWILSSKFLTLPPYSDS